MAMDAARPPLEHTSFPPGPAPVWVLGVDPPLSTAYISTRGRFTRHHNSGVVAPARILIDTMRLETSRLMPRLHLQLNRNADT